MSTARSPLPLPRCRSLTGFRIIGTGSYVPDLVVTNEDLRERFGCDSEWIVRRTGVLERRHVLPHQATTDLCYEAGRRCIERAGVDPRDIDLLILATFTPDMPLPPSACLLQDRFGLSCAAFDLHAACSGFMYGLVTGASYVLSGASDLALIIGGDCNTRVINPMDLKMFPLFGDGAGAVLLARGRPEQGLLSFNLGADGSGAELLTRPAGSSRFPCTPELLAKNMHFVFMDGRAVFRWGVKILCDTVNDVLAATGLRPNDVDLYLPHQANMRIIKAAVEILGIAPEKVYSNLCRYGNTSAGSIPLLIDEALGEGRIRPGDLIVLSGFGAGLSWGTAVLRW
jgi:3-oxoacyl-[acyl-carrier-protein] synthase III